MIGFNILYSLRHGKDFITACKGVGCLCDERERKKVAQLQQLIPIN